METIHTVKDLIVLRKKIGAKGSKIGFVPTMGTLHKGHISLVEKSVEENDITIVSVFVNPKQFNDQSDFVNYPVNHLADINLLNSIGCNYAFIPKSDDIYGDYSGIDMEFDGLDQVLEGKFRPGHFQGVVDVVYRLFDLVKPQRAYFGQKDFQQLAVIKKMVLYKKMDIEIVSCPIVREVSGLAMSSRNERLSGKQKSNSAVIYNIMIETANKMKAGNLISEYADYFLTQIQKIPEMRPEYCVFCNHRTLEEIKFVEKNAVIVMCVAVWCEKVRLIDNIILEF